MSRKTPAVAYITRLIRTTGRPELLEILQTSPLRPQEIELFIMYANGATYKELAIKYNTSTMNIYYKKRAIYEKLHFFLLRKITNENEN